MGYFCNSVGLELKINADVGLVNDLPEIYRTFEENFELKGKGTIVLEVRPQIRPPRNLEETGGRYMAVLGYITEVTPQENSSIDSCIPKSDVVRLLNAQPNQLHLEIAQRDGSASKYEYIIRFHPLSRT